MISRGLILVVEDNEATRYAVSRVLVNAGYQVTSAESGEAALERVASTRPDLVLLDVKLPDVSGFDVVRRLKADPSTAAMPVVHLSATSVSTAEQVRGLEGGADAYLTHPIEPRVLVATLDALLRARRAETRYRKLFDTGLLGIVTWDADGALVEANDAFLELVGYAREDVAGGRLRWDAIASWAPGGEGTGQALPPGGRAQEVVLARRDGERIPALVGMAARNGDHDLAVAFVLDITERKRAEEALREADRRKDDFLAVLSHELRNPLAPIRNAVALLARAPLDAGLALRARQILERQTAHLTRLVDDLLDVTRIARGKIPLQRSRVDLVELVRKTTEDLRANFDQAGVSLRTEVAAGPLWVDADPTRLSQVVSNLLHNAVKFTPDGGNVAVAVAVEGDRVEVRVRDDGIGIEPGDLPNMFEPFAQADSSLARTQGGLGLGLSLVRGLVELHGGTVSARSEGRGRGTEFTVVLPLAAGPASIGAVPGSGVAAHAARVLVIEDNADAARTLADLLELHGHRVWTATLGGPGLALALELKPDVVLCDVGLPDIDGYEVARSLRADPRMAGTRLYALSGYAQPEDRQRALAAGFDGHLAKPPSLEALERVFASARSGEAQPEPSPTP